MTRGCLRQNPWGSFGSPVQSGTAHARQNYGFATPAIEGQAGKGLCKGAVTTPLRSVGSVVPLWTVSESLDFSRWEYPEGRLPAYLPERC
jgi:hypothetical protein